MCRRPGTDRGVGVDVPRTAPRWATPSAQRTTSCLAVRRGAPTQVPFCSSRAGYGRPCTVELKPLWVGDLASRPCIAASSVRDADEGPACGAESRAPVDERSGPGGGVIGRPATTRPSLGSLRCGCRAGRTRSDDGSGRLE
jgi:hypothetical protein